MSGVEGTGVEGGYYEQLDSFIGSSPVKFSKRLLTDANGDLTVTFPVGMFSAPPVVNSTVESSVAGDQYIVELVGTPTTTTAVIKVRKFSALSFTINILGFVLNLFTAAPGATPVHVQASVAPIPP